MRTASLQQAAFIKGDGVEMNFEGADVQTVAKTLLGGSFSSLNFVVDPRVQGNVTTGIGRSESSQQGCAAERSKASCECKTRRLYAPAISVKVVPMPRRVPGDHQRRAGEPGFGVSLVPLRYTSASTVAKTAESFCPSGRYSCRAVPNVLLVQGTTAQRQAALDVVATFDVEWLQNQSVASLR